MAPRADTTILADCHYVTLILRLTLDRDGRLIRGHLQDTTGALGQRFTAVSGLNQAIADWLSRQERERREAVP